MASVDYQQPAPPRKTVANYSSTMKPAYDQAPLRQTPNHSHSRTVSSSIFPIQVPSTTPTTYTHTVSHSRRTPSNATASTISSQGGPARTTSSVSISLRRSTSTRSGQSVAPTSYVALMRKQKATVWCDRSQHEDPRILAQAKAAKLRATMEVVGGNIPGRTSTSGSMGSSSLGVRSKIRHHVVPKPAGASPLNLLVGGSGVPMRLSASEVGDEDNSDDDAGSQGFHHPRTGSGRSSLASGHRLAAYNQRPPGRLSTGSTPPSGQGSSPNEVPIDSNETPMPDNRRRTVGTDYFPPAPQRSGSGSSGSDEAGFGNVGDMQAPIASVTRKENEKKSAEELSRRGSVDERATSMRGAVRLFVANPDLSD